MDGQSVLRPNLLLGVFDELNELEHQFYGPEAARPYDPDQETLDECLDQNLWVCIDDVPGFGQDLAEHDRECNHERHEHRNHQVCPLERALAVSDPIREHHHEEQHRSSPDEEYIHRVHARTSLKEQREYRNGKYYITYKQKVNEYLKRLEKYGKMIVII